MYSEFFNCDYDSYEFSLLGNIPFCEERTSSELINQINEHIDFHFFKEENTINNINNDEQFKEKDKNPEILENKKLKYEISEKNNLSSKKTDYSSEKSGKSEKIFEITKKNKLLGRKKKSPETNVKASRKHDKFSKDNIITKINTRIFKAFLSFINNSLEEKQVINNKKKLRKFPFYKNWLLKINLNAISNMDILNSKLKDIYSSNIAKKYKNYPLDYNKNIIDKIYLEKRKSKTINILEKTFLEGLDHLRGVKYYKELQGLEEEYQNIIKDLKEETEDYIEKFKVSLESFEKRYEKSIQRKFKKNLEI